MSILKLSIRVKILMVLGFLLLVAICLYTLLASSIFREEKVALLYEINHSIAINAAAQLRSSLVQAGEQIKPFVLTRLQSSKQRLNPAALRRSHITALSLFLQRKEGFQRIPLGNDIASIQLSPRKYAAFFNEAKRSGYAFWKTKDKTGKTHFYLISSIRVKQTSGERYYAALAELDAAFFFKPLQMMNLFHAYLFDGMGDGLVSLEGGKIVDTQDVADHPIFLHIEETQNRQASGVRSYEYAGKTWYGAYTPLGIGNLFFISQADQSHVQGALAVLIKRSLWFALIVLVTTFLASILFSQRLTRSLNALAETAREFGRGKLEKRVEVNSGDEVEELAESLNWMAGELTTSRRKIEKHNKELEQKVAERTSELKTKNIAIKEAQEKLLRTTHLAAAGEIAGRTAHEILNPLTGIVTRVEKTLERMESEVAPLPKLIGEILGAWQKDYEKGGVEGLVQALQAPSSVKPGKSLLEEDLENLSSAVGMWTKEHESSVEQFKFVQNRGMRINSIINQMRKLVRGSSSKKSIQCHTATQEALNTMSDLLDKKKIKLLTDLSASSDQAVLDEGEFIQIITNIVRNASQAIEIKRRTVKDFEATIKVQTTNQSDQLLIDIVDNGPGILEQDISKIFGQGFTTKPPGEGTGLGLAICRRYARAFGERLT